MKSQKRLENEIEHGKFIAKRGEDIWNWSSPAGKVRWARRVQLFDELLGNDGKRVLEIGCGTGLFTKEIAKTDNVIIAIDISNDLLEQAKSAVPNDNVEFMIQNAYQTTFQDDEFDYVVGSSVLHHLDVEAALLEFHRILKPGGKIMFTEPNMMNPQIAIQKNIPYLKKKLGDSPDETAFFRWSLKKKMKKVGFGSIRITPFDFLHPFIPGWAILILNTPLMALEKFPIVKEISGSLIIEAKK
jgi:ubiquinone/menaquinone biosynthesis C-methylase UbiE